MSGQIRRWAAGLGLAALVGAGIAPGTAAAALDNGDIVHSTASTFYVDPVRLIKPDATVQRVLYRSSDRVGKPIEVGGTILTPNTPWRGTGARPIVGYAPGTQGMGDQCAPSTNLAAGTEYEGSFIAGLLQRGYAVAVTDYQGLGTPGTHTYMNRVVQGNAVLDVVRAAQRLPEANLPDNGPVAITGYSQGGGAAAAAAELAGTYAPELDLKGVSAGAVPSDLMAVARNIDGSLVAAFLGFATIGIAEGYDIDLAPYLNDRGKKGYADLERRCTADAIAKYPFLRSSTFTATGAPIIDILGADPKLKRIVAEQAIGAVKPSVPVLVSHSSLDEIIPYRLGTRLVADWCGKGATVKFAPNVGPSHVGGAIAAYPATFAWLEGRFAGRPAPSDC